MREGTEGERRMKSGGSKTTTPKMAQLFLIGKWVGDYTTVFTHEYTDDAKQNGSKRNMFYVKMIDK